MASYVWRNGKLVELTRAAPEAHIHVQTDAGFDNLRAPDGTDLSSRSKWKQYMHDHNLTIASDFKDTWAQAQKQRDAVARGESFDRKRRIETIQRVVNQMNPRDVKAIAERARERHRQFGKESINFRGD